MTDEGKKNDVVDLDTAITMTGLGKFHIGLVIFGGVCLASVTADTMGSGLLLPSVGCEFALSAASRGLYSGATSLGMVLTTYAWGSTSDTFGRRKTLLLSSGLACLASVSANLASVFWLLVVLRFLTGMASSALAATVYAYMSEFLPPKVRTKYIYWTGTLVGLVYCIMPVVAWLIIPLTWSLDLGFVVLRSWRILSLLYGFSMLVTFFGLLMMPESPKYLVSADKPNEAMDVLKKMFSINTGRPADEYPVRTIGKTINDVRTVGTKARDKLSVLSILKTMKDQIVLIFGRNHMHTTILACVLQFSISGSSFGFHFWIPDILNRLVTYNTANPNSTATICDAISTRPPTAASNVTCQNEMSPMVFASSLAAGAYYTVMYILAASLVNVVGKRKLMATLQLTSGMAGFALYWATDLTRATIFTTACIVQSGLCAIPLSTMISDLYPTHLRSAALCVAMTIGRFSTSLFGAIVGVLLEYDCTLTIFGLGATCIITGLLVFLIPRPTKIIELIT